jgi:hypothetical protein
MNIEREWELRPPVERTDTLHGLWRDFEERLHNPDTMVARFKDDIPRYCYEAPNARAALSRAVLARRPSGKMHNHQSKQANILPVWLKTLMGRVNYMVEEMDTFDQLYKYLWDHRIPGIGPMTVYDTAVRWGEYLGLEPEQIYVHAGVQSGLRALHDVDLLDYRTIEGRRTIPMRYLPKPLNSKPADMVEDFLCTYRSAILKLPIGMKVDCYLGEVGQPANGDQERR